MIELHFPELTVTISIYGLSLQPNNIAFRFDPDEVRIEPVLEKEFILKARGEKYMVMYLGGYIEFEETGEHIISFIRIKVEDAK